MKKILTTCTALLLVMVVFAQRSVPYDKIVGIVGDKIILKSDVFNDIQDRQRRNEAVPPNAECYIMEQILVMKALVLQAEKDSIIIGDDEIDALLDNQVRGFIQAYGSKEALEEIAGRTVYQIKEDLRQTFKERKLAEKMRDKIVEGIKITPQEVKAYWDKIPKDSLPFYESEVEIGEISLFPKASRDLERLAQDELADFKQQIESGKAKFESLASLYTDDPSGKSNGGQFALNRTDRNVDANFVQYAFRLKEGQISPVFKSAFGYHIIQMVSRAGDDAIVRHILRIPRVTDAEVNQTIEKLDSIRSKLIAGTVSFGETAIKNSEEQNAKFTGGMLQNQAGTTYLTIDQLDKDVVLAIKDLKVGGYSKPVIYEERGKKGVKIIYLKSRSEPHRENMKDDYNKISGRALELKKQNVLEKWFAAKIPNYYLMIDSDFTQCEQLNSWFKYAAKAGF